MHHFWRSVQQIGKESLYFFAAVEGVAGVEPVRLTVKEFDFELLDSVPQIICSYFEKNGIENSYNSLYDARALEVIGIEGIKKSDASGEVYGKSPEARATSDSEIRCFRQGRRNLSTGTGHI